MSTEAMPKTCKPSTDESTVCHYVCICDWSVAMCGADLTNHDYTPDAPEEDECVVCVEMDERNCERCGM